MKLGFMGFGEAAFHMAQGLVQEGLKGIIAYDQAITCGEETPVYQTLTRRAGDSGVTLVKTADDLARDADLVVLSVPGAFAAEAAATIGAKLSGQQILIDTCSSSPTLKEKIAHDCAKQGIGYVDSPMLGPLPVYGHKVPIVASGSAAGRWYESMTPWGMVIEVIDGPAGRASRIKLARSIFTKGFEALLVETFQFARKNGVEDTVMKSIGDTMNKVSFQRSAERYLAGDLVHAARRAHELEDAMAMMQASGMTPLVAEGALARLKASAHSGAAERLGGEMPGSLDEVFAVWQETGMI